MSNNRNNYQHKKDDTLDRWRNLTLSTPSASSQQQQQQPQPSQSVQHQHQSQSEQRRQPQLQFGQRQHHSQPIERQLLNSQSAQRQQQQQQQRQQWQLKQDKQKKKKGSRGDRKLQRYRAKLRKQGFDNETITMMINNYNNVRLESNKNEEQSTVPDMDVELLIPAASNQLTLENDNVNQAKALKRKRETRPTTRITTSMSQMSISNLPNKRQRSTTMNNIKEQTNIDKSTSNNKPKYLKVPDQVFKQMLSKSLTDAENIVQLLDTSEKLQFVRTYAHLLNNVYYLKLEQNFWEHYDKVLVAESIWSLPLDKEMVKKNNLSRFKFKTNAQLENHRKLIFNRLRKAENELNKHKQQQPFDRSVDMQRLSTIISAFVRQGQHKLTADFERKKRILQFDAYDYRLIKAFYNLKPTENEIRSAIIIWQATKDKLQAEEEMTILKQRIYTKRLPSSFHILDHSIDNIEQMLKRPVLSRDKCATLLSRRLKTIAQFKYDLIVLAITTAEEIVRSHTKIIMDEKKKLTDVVVATDKRQIPTVQLMNAITTRQTNMIQCHQLILKQKLSVFDDAPTTENMAGVVGAM